MSEIKKILYPTDFSKNSNVSFSHVLSLATKYKAKIDIIHVIHEPVKLTGFYIPHVSYDVMEKEMTEAADEKLKIFCEQNLKGEIAHKTYIKKGIPFDEITKAAKELGSDIIVMGTRGMTGIDHVFFGSTAERVVRTSPIPVLTVRGTE